MTGLSPHHAKDLVFWGSFTFGFAMNVLRRLSFVVRSKANPFKTRRSYLSTNWDILLYRYVFDSLFLFGPIRHMEYLPKQTPHVVMAAVMAFPQWGVAYAMLGMCADMLVETGAAFLATKYPGLAPFAAERMTPSDGADPDPVAVKS